MKRFEIVVRNIPAKCIEIFRGNANAINAICESGYFSLVDFREIPTDKFAINFIK